MPPSAHIWLERVLKIACNVLFTRLLAARAYTRPLFSSTQAVLVTPILVPLSNRLGENHAPNVFHKMCLRRAKK